MSSQQVIIGITGTHGAGKGEVVKYLEKKGFDHFSAREDILLPAVEREDKTRDRDGLNYVANLLRRRHGPDYVVRRLFELACAAKKDSVIESIYTVGEIATVRNLAKQQRIRFFLLSIDADIRIRYTRVLARQSETDRVDFDLFAAQERRELFSLDPAEHNLLACRELADIRVTNDHDLDLLHKQLDNSLRILKIS